MTARAGETVHWPEPLYSPLTVLARGLFETDDWQWSRYCGAILNVKLPESPAASTV